MYSIYDQWSKLALESYEKIDVKEKPQNVAHLGICGMGGSGGIGVII